MRHYESINDIYPMTIVMDRYMGTYSGGYYTAWNKPFDTIPTDIDDDDVTCMNFWHRYNGTVGRGATMEAAAYDLLRQLKGK